MGELADTILQPFDGDPPDRLVDEFSDALQDLGKEFEPLIEKARSIGCTVVLLISATDPLTDCTASMSKHVGDFYARIGMCECYIARNKNN